MQSSIEGLTFLGGEPFAQAAAFAELAERAHQADLSVMVFSGFTLTQLQRGPGDWQTLLSRIDLLVDGPYQEELATLDRRWIGSTNQQIHFLTDRYRHLADSVTGWDKGRNTIEFRLTPGQLQVNGFPHQAVGEWQRDESNDTPRP